MFSLICKWAGLVKLSHTVFALPFALAVMIVGRSVKKAGAVGDWWEAPRC